MSDFVWHAAGMSDVPHDDAWLDDLERERFARMAFPKRVSEARLGRWVAKTTAASFLGIGDDRSGLARVTVRNAHDGAPELFVDGRPADAIIAMSDRSDWAVTAIRRGGVRVGCDIEVVEHRSERFVRDYFTPAERALVAGGDRDLLANLIWSAKESALKVLRTGLRRDTRTVEVVPNSIDGPGWHSFSLRVEGAPDQWGWWVRYNDFVLTVACAAPCEPPVALVEPSPLASAVPTHRWMDEL